jgi:hypothetical protein
MDWNSDVICHYSFFAKTYAKFGNGFLGQTALPQIGMLDFQMLQRKGKWFVLGIGQQFWPWWCLLFREFLWDDPCWTLRACSFGGTNLKPASDEFGRFMETYIFFEADKINDIAATLTFSETVPTIL